MILFINNCDNWNLVWIKDIHFFELYELYIIKRNKKIKLDINKLYYSTIDKEYYKFQISEVFYEAGANSIKNMD